MKILAFDTASKACSACVWNDGIKASTFINNQATHSQTLLPAIDFVLKSAGLTVQDLDCIAFTGGPGSFTGVKICISMVKGLALPNRIPCKQFSVTEVLAYALPETDGIIAAAQDARRNMVYNALFRFENGALVRLTEDRQIEVPTLLEEIGTQPCHIVGDGADLLRNGGENLIFPTESQRYIQAEVIARMAANGHGTDVSADRIEPAYLRPPQAERERMERLKKLEGEKQS